MVKPSALQSVKIIGGNYFQSTERYFHISPDQSEHERTVITDKLLDGALTEMQKCGLAIATESEELYRSGVKYSIEFGFIPDMKAFREELREMLNAAYKRGNDRGVESA